MSIRGREELEIRNYKLEVRNYRYFGHKIIQKFLIPFFIFYLLMGVTVMAEGVKLKLSSTEVVDGSPLEVKIEAEGKNIVFPDIEDIGGFPVEGHSVSSKLESSYINGNFTSKSLKTLRFEFYPETNLTIPAFEVKIDGKTYKTNPVNIRVLDPSEVKEKSVDGYSLRMKSNKKTVFVGEPFIVTVDFFEPRNSSVVKVEYTPPKFKDFFSQSMGDEKLKRSSQGTLHQLQYLVSAKRDGTLVITPPKAKVAIRSFDGIDRDPWGLFSNDVKWHSIRSKPLKIVAKPVPAGVDLIGEFKVESSVDKTEVKPNSPVTYTLKIFGEGSLDDLANPKFDLPGVTVYGDDPKVTSKVVGDKVVSQYERKYVFISDSDFVIPDLHFKSFDYKSGKTKTLRSKKHNIKVEGKAAAPKSSIVKKEQAGSMYQENSIAKAPIEQTNNIDRNSSLLEDTEYYIKKAKEESQGYPFWALIIAFLAGAVTAISAVKLPSLVSLKSGFGSLKHYSNKEALKILYPHTNEDKKIEAMVKRLYEAESGNKSIKIDKNELAKMIQQVQERKDG